MILPTCLRREQVRGRLRLSIVELSRLNTDLWHE